MLSFDDAADGDFCERTAVESMRLEGTHCETGGVIYEAELCDRKIE